HEAAASVRTGAVEAGGFQTELPLRPDQFVVCAGVTVFAEQWTGKVFTDQQVGPALRHRSAFDRLAEFHADVAQRTIGVLHAGGELWLLAGGRGTGPFAGERGLRQRRVALGSS